MLCKNVTLVSAVSPDRERCRSGFAAVRPVLARSVHAHGPGGGRRLGLQAVVDMQDAVTCKGVSDDGRLASGG